MNHKCKRCFILIILLFVVPQWAYGQSLDDYLAIAAENNPGLKAAFHSYRASLEQVPQVGALPDPTLSFGLFVRPMMRFMGKQMVEASVMQMFPWFGTREAAKTEAALMAKVRYESFNAAKTALFYEVKATWYSLYMIEQEIAISEENIGILQTLEDIAVNRFKSGGIERVQSAPQKGEMSKPSRNAGMAGNMGIKAQQKKDRDKTSNAMGGMSNMTGMNGGLVDVLRIQMEMNELRNTLALLEDTRRVLTTQFNKLLNRSKDHLVVLPDRLKDAALPGFVSEMPDSIFENNPMLRMLKKEEEAFFAQGEMKRKMGFPMIGVGLQYGMFRPRENSNLEMNGRDMVMPMATVSIPLWRKKYRAGIKEADLKREAVVSEHRNVANALEVSYEEALKDFKDAERRADLYTQQTVLAEQVLEILTVEYAAAGGAFDEILRMQMKLLDFRLKGLDAVVDQHVAVAMLERLMGR